MKAKHYLFATLLSVILTGCYDDDKLWDAVNQQATRIEALESWQKETNSNIQAFQTLVSTQDFITQVTPVILGGDTVGYTIDFKNSEPINIYHGQKGDTGEKGEPGITGTVPTISATQEADGNWYWTLNGTLMKDASGNPVRANGQAGTAAPVPLLKTGKELTSQGTSGYWISDAAYLSVDNGTSWTKVSGDDGQDGTDGTDGSSGSSGDSMFSKVFTLENEGYVTFILSDLQEFKVPIYQALTLSFTYNPFGEKDVTLAPNNFIGLFDDNTTITYTIGGSINKEKVKVSALITSGSDNSEAKIDSEANTIHFEDLSEPITVSITATDNAGQSCSYILNLKKSFGEKGDSESDPFTISTPYELEYLAKQVNDRNKDYENKFYKLSNDLDLTGIEWIPIGNEENMFKGTFDGNRHTICGLKVVDQSNGVAGLFGYTYNATFKNITLISPEVETEGKYCGSLAGYTEDVTIDNCNVIDGYCSADWGVGGLIGVANRKSTLTNCHVKETTVTAESREIGGLIGSANALGDNCDITNCSATECTLTSSNGYCGGLIGILYITTLNLTACYATGSINSPNISVGALLGEEFGSGDPDNISGTVIMTGCYSTVTDHNGVASFMLQGAKTENGTSEFNACYYITDQRAETVDGITYQEKIDKKMISEMNKACGENYYDENGALIPLGKEL